VWFYVGSGTDPATVDKLRELGVHLEFKAEQVQTSGLLWRFEVCFSEGIDAAIFRDADSLPTQREANLVSEWLRSGIPIHILRDHPAHASLVMGGMWGCTSAVFPALRNMLQRRIEDFGYGCDEILLSRRLYPAFIGRVWLHSPYVRYPLEKVMYTDPPPATDYMGAIDTHRLPVATRCPQYPVLRPYPAIHLGSVARGIVQRQFVLESKETECLLYAIYSILNGKAKLTYKDAPFVPPADDLTAYTMFCKYLLDQEWAGRRCKTMASELAGQTLASWKNLPVVTRWRWYLAYQRHRKY
jgi:hypothetical protein